jgi:spermidine/putrescine-binding protein
VRLIRPACVRVAALLALVLAACSRDRPAPVAPTVAAHPAGDPERVLNVYNWTDFIEPSVVARVCARPSWRHRALACIICKKAR